MTKEELIIQIAKCEEIESARQEKNHPCHSMVANAQTDKNGRILTKEEFHLPEPFNGDIEKADILFVGINPNYNDEECYPKGNWNDKDVRGFFLNRIINKKTRYWNHILEITKQIKKKSKQTRKNINCINIIDTMQANKMINVACSDLCICVTEIVHCKSHSQNDVSIECEKYCVDKWLKQILKLFKGKYVVLIGARAKSHLSSFTDKKIIIAPYSRYIKKEDIIQKVLEQL